MIKKLVFLVLLIFLAKSFTLPLLEKVSEKKDFRTVKIFMS
jgi:hypothetical protein